MRVGGVSAEGIVASRHGTLLILVTEDWYFCSHRLPLALAARDAGWRVVVATRVGEHGERILEAGLVLRPLSLRRRGASLAGELAALWELCRLYRAERPALAHHVAMKPVIYGTLAALGAGTPRVVNAIAGLGFVFSSSSLKARLLRPVIRLAYRFVLNRRRVRVLVQNTDDARAVAGLGVEPSRVTTIPGSGVDVERFRPGPEPEGSVVAALVARMLVDKGVEDAVAAARILAEGGEPVRVRLVGPPDPDNPASLDAGALRAWAAQGVVDWCPGTDDVRGVWAQAHIALLPSYREGLPKALLEAAACGRPLVATDVPGCREVVVHGETGLLVPPRDPGALAAAIGTLARDPGLRQRLGAAARERVCRLFDQQRIVEQTLALWRDAR
jgi:glycosyltransferase involved in cell wall biosynthesis